MVNIFYVLAAAVAALILAAAIVNPFKFKQPIWHVEQFVNLHRIWQPAYEANLDISYAYLFPVIYGINGVPGSVGADACAGTRYPRADGNKHGRMGRWKQGYQLPRIDLALITIAALTVYMAFRSRRFITIAAYVSCPVIAMFADQLSRRWRRRGIFTGEVGWRFRGCRRSLQRLLTAIAGVSSCRAGRVVGLEVQSGVFGPLAERDKTYVGFYKNDGVHAKPFDACQFIKANNMQGNMFNYWTEGGFIAWGQDPDPNTGRTPLQLFMDGRAQAAYNYDAYMTWSEIMFGGDIVQRARIRQQNLTADDYVQIGEWLDNQLKRHNVWVVLMPANQFDTPFVMGLESNPELATGVFGRQAKAVCGHFHAAGAGDIQGY